MRNLDECQAEVFRRSEQRIKARKQRRRHILMACIPLVLCITLFSAFLLLGETRVPDTAGGLTENQSEKGVCDFSRVDVTGSDISLSYTKASDVLNISDQLASYMTNEPESNLTGDEESRGEGFKDETEDTLCLGMTETISSVAEEYVITFTLREGGTLVYRLMGNELRESATNKTYKLTQEQMKEICKLLGMKG